MEQLFEERKTATRLLPPLPKQVHNQVHLCIIAAITPLKIKGLGSGFDSHHPLIFLVFMPVERLREAFQDLVFNGGEVRGPLRALAKRRRHRLVDLQREARLGIGHRAAHGQFQIRVA